MRPPEGEQPDGTVVQHLDEEGYYMVWDGYPVMAYTDDGHMINIKPYTGTLHKEGEENAMANTNRR